MSKIQWTDETWNPVVGCSVVSPGCTNCYAMRQAARLLDKPGSHYHGTTESSRGGPVWTGKVALAPEHIVTAPLRWRKPRRVFVNSMGDLFHEDVSDEWIRRVFDIMGKCPQHQFQILTKRARRMRDYLCGYSAMMPWPWDHVWIGISAEDQRRADARIPDLLGTPAAVRFVSAEPLLGPVDFMHLGSNYLGRNALSGLLEGGGACLTRDAVPPLDWIIVGGESGPGARPCDLAWIRSILAQCWVAGVPCFVKQLGVWPVSRGSRYNLRDSKGGDWNEWPDDLRIREFPASGKKEAA